MMRKDIEWLYESKPYSLAKKEKTKIMTHRLLDLTEYHTKNCPEYADMLKALQFQKEKCTSCEHVPFFSVGLFKKLKLKSVSDDQIINMLMSSGTSGQKPSMIYLDGKTAGNQQRALAMIVSDYIGTKRLPMIILDCPSTIKDTRKFSARTAGILGFSIFGRERTFAFDDDMRLQTKALLDFLFKYADQPVLLFGFTFIVWKYFYQELLKIRSEMGQVPDLSKGILIHGGGWKKLSNEAVEPQKFRPCLQDICGLKHVHDYYGMEEQTGCIYMECECGHLHASNFSDVIIRSPEDFHVCGYGERGIIQVLSVIPESYPGHSLLTEDEGILLGEDDCPCGRKGKYFRVLGRLKHAEIRGCSDTYEG